MAFGSGIALGGFQQGRAQALERGIQRDKLGLLQGQLDEAKASRQQKLYQGAIEANIKWATSAASRIREFAKEKAALGDTPEVRQAIEDQITVFSQGIESRNKLNRVYSEASGLPFQPISASSLLGSVDALMAGVLSPEERIGQEAATTVAKKRGEFDFAKEQAAALDLSPEQTQQVLLKQLGVSESAQPEFIDLLKAFNNAPIGSVDRQLLKSRIDKLSRDEGFGFKLVVDADGNVRSVEVGPGVSSGAGAGGGIPTIGGSQTDTLRAELQTVRLAKNIASDALQRIEQNPERFGGVGSVLAGAETAGGLIAEFAESGLRAAGFDSAQGAFDRLSELINRENAPNDVKAALTPTSAGMVDVYQGVLKYSVARTLQPTGKLLKDTIDTARDLTDLTGLKTTARVKEKLTTILGIVNSREVGLQRRLEQGITGTATTPAISPVPTAGGGEPIFNQPNPDATSPEELTRKIDDILRKGGQ